MAGNVGQTHRQEKLLRVHVWNMCTLEVNLLHVLSPNLEIGYGISRQFWIILSPKYLFQDMEHNYEIIVLPSVLDNDEAHFWLNGYVNKQNCRIWSEANPQVNVETPLHPEKLTAWCALWAGGIIGPYFFKNNEGHNVTVNGCCDLTPLDYFLWGYVKSLAYAVKPQTLDHLEDNIRRVIADIRPQMLEKVIENWTSRLDYIRASRGSPMPEIIFKM
ncbi:uncharacterized protein TNCV_3281821 [Trichonephila clavipes]|nr:uncharacterized protein TNCV_3281821 [Trichonephila clavipes]